MFHNELERKKSTLVRSGIAKILFREGSLKCSGRGLIDLEPPFLMARHCDPLSFSLSLTAYTLPTLECSKIVGEIDARS